MVKFRGTRSEVIDSRDRWVVRLGGQWGLAVRGSLSKEWGKGRVQSRCQ